MDWPSEVLFRMFSVILQGKEEAEQKESYLQPREYHLCEEGCHEESCLEAWKDHLCEEACQEESCLEAWKDHLCEEACLEVWHGILLLV